LRPSTPSPRNFAICCAFARRSGSCNRLSRRSTC
jgi:hypothetical protein